MAQNARKFWSSFFKSLRSGGRGALLAVRRRRNSPGGVFFCELFFCAYGIKRKVGDDFLCRYAATIFVQSTPLFVILSKRSASKFW